jgi:ABC-type cobalamin/Fe3+-siderophores transport system ATPase subunit
MRRRTPRAYYGYSMDKLEWELSLRNYRCFSGPRPARFIFGGGITALIGPNNAGKSVLLRFLRDVRSTLIGLPMPGGNCGIQSETLRDVFEMFPRANRLDLQMSLRIPTLAPSSLTATHQNITWAVNRSGIVTVKAINDVDPATFKSTHHRGNIAYDGIDGPMLYDWNAVNRGLETLAKSAYIPSHRYANAGAGMQMYDMMLGQAFVDTWHSKRSGHPSKDRDEARDVERAVARLMGFKSFAATRHAHEPSLLVEIDGYDYPLADVGAGVAQLLMLLGTVSLKKPSFLFIDEPELNLHPSLQIDLVLTLAEMVGGNLVFATHSLGLARAVASRIYVVDRDASGESQLQLLDDTPTLPQLLGEMQYGAYSDIGGRRVLLVEGPEDVKVFQSFLRHFSADHQVIVMSLHGSSSIKRPDCTELAELKRICSNIAVIIDSERSAKDQPLEKAREEFIARCSTLSFRTLVTERRATENYFTTRALREAFGGAYTELQPFERFKGCDAWTKKTQYRVASKMNIDELLATDVGRFLHEWLKDLPHRKSVV